MVVSQARSCRRCSDSALTAEMAAPTAIAAMMAATNRTVLRLNSQKMADRTIAPRQIRTRLVSSNLLMRPGPVGRESGGTLGLGLVGVEALSPLLGMHALSAGALDGQEPPPPHSGSGSNVRSRHILSCPLRSLPSKTSASPLTSHVRRRSTCARAARSSACGASSGTACGVAGPGATPGPGPPRAWLRG